MPVRFGANRTLFRWHGMATALLRLSPPIYVMTPLGEAYAHVLIDYGIDHNSVWLVALCETGSVVHCDSSEVRFMGNEMLNLPHPKPFTGREVDVEYGASDQSEQPVH